MDSKSYYQSMVMFMRDTLRNVHTIKPCYVTKVVGNRVSVKVLTSTKFQDGSLQDMTIIDDVPLMIYSAQRGSARITVPVGVGDLVAVLCSDRDTGELLHSTPNSPRAFPADEITPLELYPIMAIPQFFPAPMERPISSTDIVVENRSTKVTIKPDGNIELDTPADITMNAGGNVTVNAGGNVDVTAGGTGTLSVGSTATVNAPVGVQVNSPESVFSGVVRAASIIAPVISDSESGVNLNGHRHPYIDDSTQRITDEPIPGA